MSKNDSQFNTVHAEITIDIDRLREMVSEFFVKNEEHSCAEWHMSHNAFAACVKAGYVDIGSGTVLGFSCRVSDRFVGVSLERYDLPTTTHDPVDHPKHYTSHPSGIECIQITEHMTFCLGNAVKYIWRADLKHDDATEDLRKAIWYIEREIARRGGHAK